MARRFHLWVPLGLLLGFLLVLGSGASLGVLEIEGTISLHIRPSPTATIKAGPTGGPYLPPPFVGGEPLTLEFIACCAEDPSGGSLTLAWDFDYDGVVFDAEASGSGPHQHTYPDGPAEKMVGLRLTSTTGAQSIVVATVYVLNIPPIADAGGPYTGLAGQPVAFHGSATDPGPADTAAGLLFQWDFIFDDEFKPDVSGINLTSPSFTYAQPGTYRVALRVLDKDGGASAVMRNTVKIAQGLTLVASADAWVNKDSSDTNYGGAATLSVQSRSNKDRRALVGFNLSSVPANAVIVSAQLSLFMSDVPSATRGHQLFRVAALWGETTVTWSNQPGLAASPTGEVPTPATAGWVTWNVAADVQGMVSGAVQNFGWLVKDAAEGSATTYTATYLSRENGDASRRPKLEIVYLVP